MESICDRYFYEVGNTYRGFRDDDLGDMLTAVAFYPMTEEVADKYFAHLPLA